MTVARLRGLSSEAVRGSEGGACDGCEDAPLVMSRVFAAEAAGGDAALAASIPGSEAWEAAGEGCWNMYGGGSRVFDVVGVSLRVAIATSCWRRNMIGVKLAL